MYILHDEDWLARVSDHEATQSLGTSHTATTYAVSRVAIAYHEHMMRLRPSEEYDESMGDVLWFPNDRTLKILHGSGRFSNDTYTHFQQININQ